MQGARVGPGPGGCRVGGRVGHFGPQTWGRLVGWWPGSSDHQVALPLERLEPPARLLLLVRVRLRDIEQRLGGIECGEPSELACVHDEVGRVPDAGPSGRVIVDDLERADLRGRLFDVVQVDDGVTWGAGQQDDRAGAAR